MEGGISDVNTALARIHALQSRLAAHGAIFRGPPAEPTSCCGRGCNGCVWESYYAAVSWWCEEAEVALTA